MVDVQNEKEKRKSTRLFKLNCQSPRFHCPALLHCQPEFGPVYHGQASKNWFRSRGPTAILEVRHLKTDLQYLRSYAHGQITFREWKNVLARNTLCRLVRKIKESDNDCTSLIADEVIKRFFLLTEGLYAEVTTDVLRSSFGKTSSAIALSIRTTQASDVHILSVDLAWPFPISTSSL